MTICPFFFSFVFSNRNLDQMKKHIPNLITCLNVISGTLSIFMAMYGHLEIAVVLILIAMVFDFFDGMVARLLHVKSDMGKELDSLADMVSFGLAPAIIAYFLILRELPGGDLINFAYWSWIEKILVFTPLVIPAFSAYRLAKFNLDVRQTTSFIGMPTPAHALFWIGLVFGSQYAPALYGSLFGHAWVLGICVLILSILLICELPMFSLKISGFGWKENKIQYIFFLVLILSFFLFGVATVIFIIPLYILFAVIGALSKVFTRINP